MFSRLSLLIPVSFVPNFTVSDRLPLISMLICSKTGEIMSCVYCYGDAIIINRVRVTLNALANLNLTQPFRFSTGMFSISSVVVGAPGRAHMSFDEWSTGYHWRRDLHGAYLNPEWSEVFFYFLYDRPLDCYPSYGVRDISTVLFRKLLRVTLSRYDVYVLTRSQSKRLLL